MSTLLSGRVRHAQPADGHRSGIEPVLLAASVPAAAGESVLEGGTGSGAGLLCLAARVPGIAGVGLELDRVRAAQAAENFAANGFAGLQAVEADVTAWRDRRLFHHAMANPPFHRSGGTDSADPARVLARAAAPGLLPAWAAGLARRLRHRGTLTFVLSAAALPEAMAGFAGAGCGSLVLLPLWVREGAPARLLLLQGRLGGRAPMRVLPGLALHAASGGYSAAAEAVLRGGAAIHL